uniref:Glutathione peroxidase 4a n=1 Tax=Oncorhynchus tshawytscha TaxID=74940 RepID=A0AAZ3NQH6_ONCTS
MSFKHLFQMCYYMDFYKDTRRDPNADTGSRWLKDWQTASSLYDFSAKDIDGNEVSLEKYRGDVVIIVNVFAEMHAKYAEKGLRILAFPSNQFGRQEPGTESQIKNFAKSYNADFPMFSKINVNGPNAHPVWKWLKEQPKGRSFLGNGIKWNFTKVYIYFLLVIGYSHQNKLTQLSWSNPEFCAKIISLVKEKVAQCHAHRVQRYSLCQGSSSFSCPGTPSQENPGTRVIR